MPTFTPSHLGKWESLFTDLVGGEGSALTEEGIWMLGAKPGLVCVFDEEEPLYIEAVDNISKTLQCYLKGGSECDFRTMVGIVEMGASFRLCVFLNVLQNFDTVLYKPHRNLYRIWHVHLMSWLIRGTRVQAR